MVATARRPGRAGDSAEHGKHCPHVRRDFYAAAPGRASRLSHGRQGGHAARGWTIGAKSRFIIT